MTKTGLNCPIPDRVWSGREHPGQLGALRSSSRLAGLLREFQDQLKESAGSVKGRDKAGCERLGKNHIGAIVDPVAVRGVSHEGRCGSGQKLDTRNRTLTRRTQVYRRATTSATPPAVYPE